MSVTPRKRRVLAAASTNATVLKTGGSHLRGVYGYTIDATPVYVKFYDKAITPDENDTPVFVFVIPAATTATLGSVNNVLLPDPGITFEEGLAYRIVTGIADNDTGAVSAAEVIVNIAYD